SENILSEYGVVEFVFPYEIMTVEYGKKSLRFLCDFYERIDIFVSNEKAFPYNDQDAVIILGQINFIGIALFYIKYVD
ncbi:hypothetical protein, partial [Pseudomonas sp. C11]|uniref:hypothetical protein n=1 Tax=Pseudomonas sp. C11 TaxID=3075550 RepID=UPI002AFF57C5